MRNKEELIRLQIKEMYNDIEDWKSLIESTMCDIEHLEEELERMGGGKNDSESTERISKTRN